MESRTATSRRWLFVLPMVFITYSLAYLDRANYGFAAAAHMSTDLSISKSMASLIGALFFLGYFFFQIPAAYYAQQRNVKKLIFWSLILWGGCATLTGMVHNAYWLLAIRFLLGAVEAAVMPAMLIYLSNWFTRDERSRANTVLILGNPVTVLWMSILSGYLVHAFGWRLMFIIEGLPAVLWAVVWALTTKERPADADWLDEQEKTALAAALAQEQAGLKAVKNYREAFRQPKVILLCLQYFCWSIGVYGFVLWLPSILREASKLDMVATGWLSALPYLAAVLAMLTVSHFSDKLRNRKLFVWPPLLLGALAFLGSFLVGGTHFWLAYGLLVIAGAAMYAPYGPFFAIVPEMLPKNVAGGAMALINSTGALGGFLGSYLVGYFNSATGSPDASYIFMAGSLFVSALVTLLVRPEPQPDIVVTARPANT